MFVQQIKHFRIEEIVNVYMSIAENETCRPLAHLIQRKSINNLSHII